MSLEIFTVNTQNDSIKFKSVELFFNEINDQQLGESFVHELLTLTTKYKNLLTSITFKENN